ncbi:S1C family serine protease [Zunongwangia endophytica]|uniref:S1C family serine protease n=1 Tax=Zunongwangia endophytica TaxID=1808945 RepID=A0ABV8HDG8_9FLAO|nr:trypsin-like peptidase domain-containing protein [Zunongwangia endophytica]MDN3596603.1 trypsin-like peptidase domain-containing protein [Zunongwangia endophytica]
MKKLASLLMVSILGGAITLGSYKLFFDEENGTFFSEEPTATESLIQANYNAERTYGTNVDFTTAAENTVHAVVHVKNVAVYNGPRSWADIMQGRTESSKALRGTGSGVIITPDGYIVTNNHVIDGASELEVTLNNNKTYKAKVIGADAISDIALIKVEPEEELDYIPFGNSNNVKVGEWVLAVGNPFNLKSTVTAGIVSAKSRNLNPAATGQSFIQTDAAINPGNSGGALVNINGELVGINTAITSMTGSYVGYAFAVPSNNAKKIVDDIMEYGNIQQGILGIRGSDFTRAPEMSEEYGTTQGVFVSEVTKGSGAEKAGIKSNDVIKKIDNISVNKFSDLTGYINTKRPNDTVNVVVLRNGTEKEIAVKLTKLNVTQLPIGLEVTNATKDELKFYQTENGVKISKTLSDQYAEEEFVGSIITEINGEKIYDIRDADEAFKSIERGSGLSMTFIDKTGQKQRVIFR